MVVFALPARGRPLRALFSIHAVVILRFGGVEHEEIVLDLEERLGVDLGPAKTLAKRFL
ncbi:MAG: hypothetical protein IH933_03990 [Euryarchaeota archaeon]|nr:hypothetical protein [Euryarchaeota archaeon]